MKLKSIISIFILLVLLTSCRKPIGNYCVVGPDEFVIDSYKIREGKLAILEMMGECVGELPPNAMCEYRDAIREDDLLNIVLYHPRHQELMNAFDFINTKVGGFRVTNGYIDLPDIPPVKVEGLTLFEARDELQNTFREQMEDIELFVTYRDRERQKVELTGMVARENILVDGKIRLYDVISKAKINPSANLFMSYVLRDGQQLPVDLYKLINEGDMSQNIVIHGGDKIFIAPPGDAVVMMMGEINHPSAIAVPYGYITLPEAIVAAGGIPFTGNRRHIQIIRGDLTNPKIYSISWEHIVHLPNRSMLLMPGDTVYVSEKPITQWNRFISQLMPSLVGAREAYGTYHLFK